MVQEPDNPEHRPQQAPCVGSITETPPCHDIFEVWKEYERIAMHFNELIIRLRSQSLGGVAAFAALAAVILRGDVSPELRWGTLASAFFLLSLFWLAVWVLDFGYYNRLLLGAVKALLEIERLSARTNRIDRLILSTQIEDAVAEGAPWTGAEWRRARGRWIFYATVFVALLVGLAVSIAGVGGFGALYQFLSSLFARAPPLTTGCSRPRALTLGGPSGLGRRAPVPLRVV